MLTRNTVVLAKIEAAYGTDPVPTPSANAIAVRDLEIKPAGETVERNIMRGTLSPLRFVRGTKSVEVAFKTEMKGTGTRGALPSRGWEGVLFRACGMGQTINAGVDIVYAPVSTGFESCTLYVYRDGLFHKVTGCRGTFRIGAEAGKPALAEWKFKGLYLSPAAASPGALQFNEALSPVAAGAGFTIGGFGPVAEKCEVDINNTVVERKSLIAAGGVAGFEITGRRPQGSFDPEAVAESSHPFWSNWESASPLALILQVGSADGNRFSIEAPALQYRDIGPADRDGRAVYQVPFALSMSAGDDELAVRFS
ncbi:MAG: phage tail tube protein [Syntrophobacteraceae bacterium]